MSEPDESLAQRELRLIGQLSKVHREISDLLPPATEPLLPDRPDDPRPLWLEEYRPLKAEKSVWKASYAK